MYENCFSQSIQSRKNCSNRADYTESNKNDCESVGNTIFLNSWIYECFEELILRLRSKEECQHNTERNRRVDEEEWNWWAVWWNTRLVLLDNIREV